MKISSYIEKNIADKKNFYSLEFFPPKDQTNLSKFFSTVEKLKRLNPLFASVTYGAGGTTQENTLSITAHLAKAGIRPMAHLTCVGATSEKIYEYLKRLKEANVTNVLALRGDAPKDSIDFNWNNCEFTYASDLVNFVQKKFPEFGIAVAAYPSPHPESSSIIEDRVYTQKKMEESGFAITQLFFDHREYFEYVRHMRELGVKKTILPGILPVQSLDSIKKILSLGGGNIPAKLYLSLEKAHEKGGSQAVREAGIAFAIEQIKRLIDGGAPGIHLYTLNNADICLRIADGVGKI